jgi:hypothetical protein
VRSLYSQLGDIVTEQYLDIEQVGGYCIGYILAAQLQEIDLEISNGACGR